MTTLEILKDQIEHLEIRNLELRLELKYVANAFTYAKQHLAEAHNTVTCTEHECPICGWLACPHNCPEHNWKDGCPCCYDTPVDPKP
jgi:hypothetical protein